MRTTDHSSPSCPINQSVSELGPDALSDAGLLRFNARLVLAVPRVVPLPLNDASLSCRHLHALRYRPNTFNRRHQHQEIEVQYSIEGEYTFETNHDRRTIRPGEGLTIVPDLPHESVCDGGGVRLSALVRVTGTRAPSFLDYLNKLSEGKFRYFGGPGHAVQVAELLRLALARGPDIWQREMISGLLQLWLGKLLSGSLDLTPWRCLANPSSRFPGDRSAVLSERACEFIYANFHRSISLGDIAQHVGVTPRHLSRIFQQFQRKSVKATLHDVRLTEAYRKLSSDPTLPIKEVAYATGFASPSYFSQCFKRKYGVLPNDVRCDLPGVSKDSLGNRSSTRSVEG